MELTIHTTFLPHDDPDASVAFWRDALGFQVRSDVGEGKMRWITVGPAGQPGTSILLGPPAADPGITADERRTTASSTVATPPAPALPRAERADQAG